MTFKAGDKVRLVVGGDAAVLVQHPNEDWLIVCWAEENGYQNAIVVHAASGKNVNAFDGPVTIKAVDELRERYDALSFGMKQLLHKLRQRCGYSVIKEIVVCLGFHSDTDRLRIYNEFLKG